MLCLATKHLIVHKILSGQTFNTSSEPSLWHWLWQRQQCSFFTRYSSLLWCTIKQSLVQKRIRILEDINKKQSYFDHKSRNCGLDLEDSKTFFCTPILWWCTTIPGLVTKGSVVKKIRSRQTSTEILKNRYDHLEHSNPIFSQDTLWRSTIKLSLVAKES